MKLAMALLMLFSTPAFAGKDGTYFQRLGSVYSDEYEYHCDTWEIQDAADMAGAAAVQACHDAGFARCSPLAARVIGNGMLIDECRDLGKNCDVPTASGLVWGCIVKATVKGQH